MNNGVVNSAIGADNIAREAAHPHSMFNSFKDELVKIAFFQTLRNGFVNTLKEGWNGTNENKSTWFGKGRELRPGMGRTGRMVEEATSLGGATRALPIGSKSMMALGTGLMAREALKRVDASGQQRSRTERMSGLTGNTIGGLVGSTIGNRFRPGLLGSLAGGLIGAGVGEKTLAAPFAMARQHRLGAQAQQIPQQAVEGVPA